MKTGRNDPCPCGSGKKYKKCCLTKDEASEREASAAKVTRETAQAKNAGPAGAVDAVSDFPNRDYAPVVPLPEPKDTGEPKIAPEVKARLTALWDAFEVQQTPTVQQMEDLLTGLFAQPPEATNWSDVMHALARADHPDLGRVFQRIAVIVPQMHGNDPAFFFWSAAEEFLRHGMKHLLPDVGAGFCRLDLESYDPDALAYIENYLLAAGFDAETLQLAEHFLRITRTNENLTPWVEPEQCQIIFELRVGQALRTGSSADDAPETLIEALRKCIKKEVHVDAATTAVAVITGQKPPPVWTRGQFDLVLGDLRNDSDWRDYLRYSEALMRVAQEAWQVEKESPGSAFRGLSLLATTFSTESSAGQRRSKHRGAVNLLDLVRPDGFEGRIARACPGMIGVNVPRVRLLLRATGVFARFANRHDLMSADDASAVKNELSRLSQELGSDE